MKLRQTQLLPSFSYTCRKCGKRQISEPRNVAYADLDGEPFNDYYCPRCATNHDARLNHNKKAPFHYQCSVCRHAFKRKNICQPKTFRLWRCPKRACTGYGIYIIGAIQTVKDPI
jgi:predicted RNA-binding Zn-ribbon protein involved in translation (DUF1610 family)